jgi:hypothetical protein
VEYDELLRAYLVFVPDRPDGYRISFLRDDARTPYPRKATVEDSLLLARVVARLNGNCAVRWRDGARDPW